MKETLRRLFLATLYIAAIVRFFTLDIHKKLFDGIIVGNVEAWVWVIVLILVLFALHKCINWIFQKGEKN